MSLSDLLHNFPQCGIHGTASQPLPRCNRAPSPAPIHLPHNIRRGGTHESRASTDRCPIPKATCGIGRSERIPRARKGTDFVGYRGHEQLCQAQKRSSVTKVLVSHSVTQTSTHLSVAMTTSQMQFAA
jgi:hypothetical protein